MAHLSTHVLDASRGRPACGVEVILSDPSGMVLSNKQTDHDGRIGNFEIDLLPGKYRLTFDTASYFASEQIRTFYPEVIIAFEVSDATAKYHVPLLLSPFSYSTYRGS